MMDKDISAPLAGGVALYNTFGKIGGSAGHVLATFLRPALCAPILMETYKEKMK